MAATAEALVREHQPPRPDLRLVPGTGSRSDRRRATARRRRVVVLALVAAVAFVSGFGVASAPGQLGTGETGGEPAPAADAAGATVVVAPGDTVWDLARAHLPEGSRPRDYVAEIVEANDLDPRTLRPGTVVRLP